MLMLLISICNGLMSKNNANDLKAFNSTYFHCFLCQFKISIIRQNSKYALSKKLLIWNKQILNLQSYMTF